MRILPILTVPLLLASCAYEPPLRPGAEKMLNAVHGSVLLEGPEVPAPVIIVVFNASNPGPPEGTGTPVSFTTVHPDDFAEVDGGFTAPWIVSGLPDGTWQFDALLDVDGDFSPFPVGLAGATCGDWGGSYLSAGERGKVTVKGGEYIDGLHIVVDSEFVSERPAFAVRGDLFVADRESGTVETTLQEYWLDAIGVHTSYEGRVVDPLIESWPDGYPLDLDGPCASDETDPMFLCDPEPVCETAFWLYLVDSDGDGIVDPHPDYDEALGLRDIWPRIYLQYLGVPEIDGSGAIVRDDNGVAIVTPPDLPEGEFWGSENFPYAANIVFSLPITPVGVPTPVSSMKVAWAPAMAHFYPTWNDDCVGEPPEDPNTPCQGPTIDIREPDVPFDAIPAGLWAINVIQYTGQTWTMPNEIGIEALPERDGFSSASQNGLIRTK